METAEIIKNLREKTGLSRRAFATTMGIPLRTIEDWEAARRTPPEYIPRLLAYKIEMDLKNKCKEAKATAINYDGRMFVSKANSRNGEVDDKTIFLYHQDGDLLWAEYSGGNILKGTLIGSVSENGELDFSYQHMNQNMQIKTGTCHSVPTVQENGKIELSEKWQWTCGECTKGNSVIIEV